MKPFLIKEKTGRALTMPGLAFMAIRGGAPAVPAFMMLPAAIDEGSTTKIWVDLTNLFIWPII
jgi:hypothetical protein